MRLAPADEDAAAPGPRLPRDAERNRRSLGRCPIASNSFSAIRSTSPKIRYHPVCTIAWSGWLHFRIPSSTRRRRCACRPTTSRASSPVPRTLRSTSVCHAAAWTTSKSCLSDLRIDVVMRDERNAGKPLDVQFQGELHPEQAMAARDLLAHDTGVLSATTAFGKTVVAAWLIAERGGQYAGSRASPAIAGTMGGAIVGVSRAVIPSSSAESAAGERSRPGRWTWRSSKAWCERTS